MDDGFVILIEYAFLSGDVIHFAVILTRLDGTENVEQICRYDTAHGFAHLDLLDKRGRLVEKKKLSHPGRFNQALTYAVHDFKTNYRSYWKKFLQD